MAGDREQPGPRVFPIGVQRRGMLPGAQQRLVHDVLGALPVAVDDPWFRMWAASGRRIPECFPPCVPEHGVALFGFILRLVDGDRQRAEDVVHETLLRAWKHPAALHPYRENPRPWLFTVARHLVIDERRARRTSPAVPTFTRLRHSWYGVSRPPVMPTAGEGARRAQLHPPTA